ncbi:PucR family transcriptional regulator [Marinactinospora thermotolerans]|uniref:DNA-binding transcriptional regulator, PucR family n=1 Tax=Marinactinospora thermotolerans DSM 45154 TaxID=1122192 RepID=A0A1T4NSU6_9ACTN|nr:PucR family transcriptional regulator [Marinactinospora thermotolerans]SJZ81778.1 DNA-binding transcriptional regulator, PucR family [Marinactinospora thermotolerans DSM 45154]
MQISELVAIPRLRLRFLSGAEQARRDVRWVYTTDLLEPARYLSGGELVLTGMMWHNRPEDSETFVRSLVRADVACLAAGTALGEVPDDLVRACERHGMPLLEVPPETGFGAVTEEAIRLLERRRFVTIAERRDRHRRLMTEVATGGGLSEALTEAAWEADVTAWVLSATGRTVVQTGPTLTAAERTALAGRFLTATTFPLRVDLPPRGEGAPRVLTLMAVRGRDPHPLAGWFLAVTGDHNRWPEERQEAVAELLSIVVLARSRDEERAADDARRAEGIAGLLTEQRFDEVAALLRTADRDGAGPTAGHVVLSAMLLPRPRVPDLARRVVTELVAAHPGAIVTGEDDVLAIVPVAEAEGAAELLREEIAHGARVLERGLGEHRLVVGVASMARDVAGLRGAAVEARHARRLAELRGGPSRVIAGAEIDSHELLLASVPQEVQSSYRDRLLGPLLDYDRDHRSDLVETLETFLRHSGSWQRCAAAMHVHVNTLRYRIGRIEELTGRDLSSLEHRVDLFLALKLRG